MAVKDYYSLLGVGRKAGDKEIRQAYRRLARKYHPDVNPGDKTGGARFKEINEAYEVLSDPEKRRKYDLYGENWQYADRIRQAGRSQGAPGDIGAAGTEFDIGDLFGRDASGIFGNIMRNFGRKSAWEDRQVEVTLEEAYSGAARVLDLPVEEKCATCGGSGRLAGAICHVCQGSGGIERRKRFEVRIPAGVSDGARLQIATGEGRELGLLVRVLPHGVFERRGDDLYAEIEVPLEDAVLGGEAAVSTIAGKKVMLKVPRLSRNGSTLRLAGLGMPRRSGAKGDLYVKVSVALPSQISEQERDLFEELRSLHKARQR